MSLEVHHLQLSQSERIVWLVEEMQIPYKLVLHERDPKTGLAPESFKSLTPAGTAPCLIDKSVSPPVLLMESGAIVQYILEVYGPNAPGTRMFRKPGDPDYANYLDWLHFSNATIFPRLTRMLGAQSVGSPDSPAVVNAKQRFEKVMALTEDHLSKNKFLAGDEVSAADCMTVVIFTTLRGFLPIDLNPYPNILRYTQDATARPAYLETMKKGENGLKPMIEPQVARFTQFEAFRPSTDKKD